MFDWLRSADAACFRFVNHSLANPFFDWLMPRASDPPYGVAVIVAVLVLLAWRGGARGRLAAGMFVLALCFGNWMVVDTIKHLVARPRPFYSILDARLLVGRTGNFSMPSSHSANWFSAAMIGLIYYRRSGWWLVPCAALVAFSRVYNGVHYPSDVIAGAVIGAGYAAAIVWSLDALWQSVGPRWFSPWWRRLPSLMNPIPQAVDPSASVKTNTQHWARLGYALAGLIFLARLAFLASGKLELTEDEAYQWIWSKHLAISYYSKPLLIAYTQWLGTHLWGDNEFGVRFFSPVITLIISILLLRFIARIADGKAAFVLFLVCCATPLLALGSILMTIDPLSVLFWTAAMIIGWRAVQPNGTTRDWLWVGLWLGLGFLSKYTNLVQVVCLAVFFGLWSPARAHLRKPGPWLALALVVISLAPVAVWNAQRDWITVKHVASDGQLEKPWTRTYVHEFLLAESGLLHPVFFLGAIWASIAFWRRGRRDPLQLYLFSMGAPLFVGYFLLSWHSRVLPNWIAPAVVPMFCLMIIYWRDRWQTVVGWLRPLLCLSLGIGIIGVVLAHAPKLIEKIVRRPLPSGFDPLRRAHGWKEFAAVLDDERDHMEALYDQPLPLLIGEHYGFTSEATFYIPEAKARVRDAPFVFFYATARPLNQFYFWPSYLDRTGADAIFFREVQRPKLRHDWLGRWWRHEDNLYEAEQPENSPPPPEIRAQFQSVTNLGAKDIIYDGKVVRRVQFFACRYLR